MDGAGLLSERAGIYLHRVRAQLADAPPKAKRLRLGGLDALRGVAALAVVLFHSMLTLYAGVLAQHAGAGSRFDRIASYLSWPTHYGYVGVMLFFVLSGFVIHLPYAAGKRRFVFGSYLARRTLRIYPPYAAALALSVVVATHVHVAHLAPFDARTALKAVFFLQNYPHWGGPGAELAWLQPAGNIALWSLPVEFELYLAYPLLLFLMRRFSLNDAMLVALGVSLAAAFVEIFIARPAGARRVPNLANYLPTFMHYWIVWGAGAWLAEKYARREMPQWSVRWTIAFAASLLLSIANRRPLLPNDIGDYVLMIVFVCAIVWLSSRGLLAGTGLGRPLVRLGDMSYSLYLVHMPIFIVMAAVWTHARGNALPANYLISVGAALVAIPIAYAFSLAFERPSIAFAARAGRALDRRARFAAFDPGPDGRAPS
jgi:peptidoglycan/LPS O-acetylase OafA/YrhL